MLALALKSVVCVLDYEAMALALKIVATWLGRGVTLIDNDHPCCVAWWRRTFNREVRFKSRLLRFT